MDLRNAVTLAGRLGADSDVITSTHTDAEIGKRSEARLVEFSLATNRSNPVEWHQFAAYADAHIKHLSQLKKGEKVQINRYIRNDRTKRDGVKVTERLAPGAELADLVSRGWQGRAVSLQATR